MAYLLKGILENPKRLLVESILNIETNPELDLTSGVIVDEYPIYPEYKRGFQHILYVNPKTGKVFFEEKSRPLTREEQLEVQLEEVQVAIDTLILDSLKGGL